MDIYLAGGAVRDLLLGKPIADRDYLVMNATKAEFMEAHPRASEVGLAFPVFLLDRQEFSFPRGTSLTEDLKARDLTVNALMLDEKGDLICHPKGLEDLHNKVLRPASFQSFIDDPLRVYRAARFWARFPEFTPHSELIEAMQFVTTQNLFTSIAPDRIGQETVKVLLAPKPGNYLRLLAKGNCLHPWFSEFENAMNIPAGPPRYHDSDVLEHTCRVMDSLAGDPVAVWMGLCHDLGKTMTEEKYWPNHRGHDQKGAHMAETLSSRIRLSNQHITAGSKAARWHMVAARYDELRAGTRVDLLMDLHFSRTLKQLFALVKADHGIDHLSKAEKDLGIILPIRLPAKYQNLGARSGEILREFRAAELAKRSK